MIDLYLLTNVYSAAHSSVGFKYPDIEMSDLRIFSDSMCIVMVIVEINAIFIQKTVFRSFSAK